MYFWIHNIGVPLGETKPGATPELKQMPLLMCNSIDINTSTHSSYNIQTNQNLSGTLLTYDESAYIPNVFP